MFERLMNWLHEPSDQIVDMRIEQLVSNEQFEAAKKDVLKLATKRPIIIAFDTLEKCNTSDDSLMNAMAALVQCAADFNLKYRRKGIHLKVFMLGEVFPYLEEDVLQNPLKSIQDPVYEAHENPSRWLQFFQVFLFVGAGITYLLLGTIGEMWQQETVKRDYGATKNDH
jgi:hypothetical protein